MNEFTLPAGTYFFGDPCYAIADELWEKVVDQTFFAADTYVDRVIEVDGHKLFVATTMYGDGTYYDGTHEYGVDSGSLGAVPKEMWDPTLTVGALEQLGRIVTYDRPFQVGSDEQSTIYLGNITIPTNGENEDGEVEDYDDDYVDEYDDDDEAQGRDRFDMFDDVGDE